MNIKYKKPLIVSSIINLLLGGFLIICGLLEFTGVLDTPANNSISTLGVQLSYVVFTSGLLVFISGIVTFFDRKSLYHINLEMFLGLIALAFPIFISVVLILQAVICIRLIPTILTSLFYMIAILIVKLSNEEMRKTHKLNTTKLTLGERRKQGVNITSLIKNNNTSGRKKTANISSIGELASITKSHKNPFLKLQKSFGGRHKRRTGGGFSKRLYSGARKKRKF
ncbi:MAG: hypothetical protein IJH37_00345 [Clostridia bacterium]|nr:hypothetical protein [Clostridia bacterium]